MAKRKPIANPFEIMKRTAEEKFGARTFTGKESAQMVVGVPIESLALQYLLDSNVLPLSKIMAIAGPSQSQKSSLSYEFARMIMGSHEGGANYIETEGEKMSPSLIESIVGSEYLNQNRFNIMQMTDLTEAQKLITSQLKLFKEVSQGQPLAMILDSMVGSEGGETYTKVHKEGSWSRGYSEAALMWTSYLKVLAADLVGTPITFFLLNHLKESPNPLAFMPPIQNTPGGKAQWFHSSIYLYVHRHQAKQYVDYTHPDYDIKTPVELRRLKLQCKKSSIGTDGRYINVDFVWFHVKDDAGAKRQVSIFDWDAATADMLVWMQGERAKGVSRKDVRQICDVSATRGIYTSKKLGVEGLTNTEFGRAVHANKAVLAELVDYLSIKQHPTYTGAMPDPKKLEAPTAPKVEPVLARKALKAVAQEDIG